MTMKRSIILCLTGVSLCWAVDPPKSHVRRSTEGLVVDTDRDLFLFAGRRCPQQRETCLSDASENGVPVETWGAMIDGAKEMGPGNDLFSLAGGILTLVLGTNQGQQIMGDLDTTFDDALDDEDRQQIGEVAQILTAVQRLISLSMLLVQSITTFDIEVAFITAIQLLTATGGLFPQSVGIVGELVDVIVGVLGVVTDAPDSLGLGAGVPRAVIIVGAIANFLITYFGQVSSMAIAKGNRERVTCASELVECEFKAMVNTIVPEIVSLAFLMES